MNHLTVTTILHLNLKNFQDKIKLLTSYTNNCQGEVSLKGTRDFS